METVFGNTDNLSVVNENLSKGNQVCVRLVMFDYWKTNNLLAVETKLVGDYDFGKILIAKK